MNDPERLKTHRSEPAKAISLPPCGAWPAAWHLLRRHERDALRAALLSGRPLLVRGEPGVGKSQLARAAAELYGRRFLSVVIQPNTEYEDLLWAVDHTARLAVAQAGPDDLSALDTERFVRAGPLWWALDPYGAEAPERAGLYRPFDYEGMPDWSAGAVLLVDEIDKADVAVADGLLEALGNGAFSVPPLRKDVVSPDQYPPPLVVFTSNDARSLSPAFVRRCVVLRLELPENIVEHLVEVGRCVVGEGADRLDDDLLVEAARQIERDRREHPALPKAGQAEYLDLLRVLQSLPAETRRDELAVLGRYFLKGHGDPR